MARPSGWLALPTRHVPEVLQVTLLLCFGNDAEDDTAGMVFHPAWCGHAGLSLADARLHRTRVLGRGAGHHLRPGTAPDGEPGAREDAGRVADDRVHRDRGVPAAHHRWRCRLS